MTERGGYEVDRPSALRKLVLQLMNKIRHECSPAAGGFSQCGSCRKHLARGGIRCVHCLSGDLATALVSDRCSREEAERMAAALVDSLQSQAAVVDEILGRVDEQDEVDGR